MTTGFNWDNLSPDLQQKAMYVATELAVRAMEPNQARALKGQQNSMDPHAPGFV